MQNPHPGLGASPWSHAKQLRGPTSLTYHQPELAADKVGRRAPLRREHGRLARDGVVPTEAESHSRGGPVRALKSPRDPRILCMLRGQKVQGNKGDRIRSGPRSHQQQERRGGEQRNSSQSASACTYRESKEAQIGTREFKGEGASHQFHVQSPCREPGQARSAVQTAKLSLAAGSGTRKLVKWR